MLETMIAVICFIIVIGVTGFALFYFRDNAADTPKEKDKKSTDTKGER